MSDDLIKRNDALAAIAEYIKEYAAIKSFDVASGLGFASEAIRVLPAFQPAVRAELDGK
jgi:hypothetical protein